jgi:predicted transcriptional regulator
MERVAPLADCGTFLLQPLKSMIAALAWAYWDDKYEQNEIAALSTEEELRDYLVGKEKEILILLDQVQALDADLAAKTS